MDAHGWVAGFPGSVTVCDADGVITEMNLRSAQSFADEGGAALIDSNVLDCHPEPARSKLRAIMEERRMNVYTIEKAGKHKLVLQAPWFTEGPEGEFGGYVEMVIEVPADIPHYIRGV